MGNDIMHILGSPLFSGLVAGICGALLTFLFTRKKSAAEIKKIEAETKQLTLENEKMQKEVDSHTQSIASVGYKLSATSERVLYDSSNAADIGYNFKGYGGRIYKKNPEGIDVPITPVGEGALKFDKGILNIERSNTTGRFEVHLQSYMYEGIEREFITKDNLREGRMHLKISGDVKVSGGEHTLKFIFRGVESKRWLTSAEKKFKEEIWSSVSLYFEITPTENFHLRIDDQDVSSAPSSIQIRNFVLMERLS